MVMLKKVKHSLPHFFILLKICQDKVIVTKGERDGAGEDKLRIWD